jgi:transcriptional regulator with XRE-family HTH domain
VPPRRRTTTRLGESLRAARKALHLRQAEFAALTFTSSRQVSRWENGQHPTVNEVPNIVAAVSSAPPAIAQAVAEGLGINVTQNAHAPPSPLRAGFDAIILGAAERRDVLPRHLREFAVEMFEGADRLGLSARDAARLVAAEERTKGT